MDGFAFDTRAEDLRNVWIPLSLKMSISKSQGLEISSWPEGEEVRTSRLNSSSLMLPAQRVALRYIKKKRFKDPSEIKM